MPETSPEIVDSHCHLDFPDFDAERAEVVGRAVAAGVRRMVTICTRLRNAPNRCAPSPRRMTPSSGLPARTR